MRSWVAVVYTDGETNHRTYPTVERGAHVAAELARVAHMLNIASIRFEVEPVTPDESSRRS